MPTTNHVYSQDWRVPASFGVWGGSPGDRARLASALAHRIDPEPFWLQIEHSPADRDPEETRVVSRVPENHLFVLTPADFGPENGAGNMATWFLRTDVAGDDRLRHLADFVRLPTLARNLLEGRSSYSPTKALVIANSDRLQPLYPVEEGGVRPFIEAFHEYAASVIFTLTESPQPNARDVDYLMRLEVGESKSARNSRVTFQQGAPPQTPGLFTIGSQRELTALLELIGSP